jgi:fermentation-respiration switch protein FrsA (DUF1100 family)
MHDAVAEIHARLGHHALARLESSGPLLSARGIRRRLRAIRSGRAACRAMAALSGLVSRISPRATFFIYAGHGGGGEDQTPAYYAAAKQPKQLWEIPEAGHTAGLAARAAEYERRVTAFFDRYLLQ